MASSELPSQTQQASKPAGAVARIQASERLHRGGVAAIAFSPRGDVLASAGYDHEVRLWNTSSWAQLREMSGHGDAVNSLAFAPNGRILVSGSFDSHLRVWNAATGALLKDLVHKTSWPTALRFSPDGRMLASVWTPSPRATGSVQILDTTSWNTVRDLGDGRVGPGFSPDNRTLATGCNSTDDCEVLLWDVSTWTATRRLGSGKVYVSANSFFADGKTLASVTYTRETVSLFDVESGKLISQLPVGSRVESVAFSPDNEMLVTASRDNLVRIWDIAGGMELRRLDAHSDWAMGVAFSPNGRFLACASADKIIVVWDAGASMKKPPAR